MNFSKFVWSMILISVMLPLSLLAQIHYNPIIPDMIADPSIVKFGDTYYCYATTDGYGRGLATSGPPVVWKSKDFVHWSFKGILFPSMKNQLYWAPSKVVKANGKYYLYPTLNTHIYGAVSKSPEGPFKLAQGADTLVGPKAPKPMVYMKGPRNSKGIDAEIFTDDNGQSYMFWAQRGAAKLDKDMLTLDTVVNIIDTKRRGYSEGPIFFKRKGIYYYLYTMDGNENYKYAYVYSKVSPLWSLRLPGKRCDFHHIAQCQHLWPWSWLCLQRTRHGHVLFRLPRVRHRWHQPTGLGRRAAFQRRRHHQTCDSDNCWRWSARKRQNQTQSSLGQKGNSFFLGTRFQSEAHQRPLDVPG